MESKLLSPLSSEFRSSDLGDKRRTRRVMAWADAAAKSPGESLPEQAGSAKALEGVYRLASNKSVSPESILDSHIQCTLQRASAESTVLVIHDTTKFRFGGEQRRKGLGRLNAEAEQGFFAHWSFCSSLDGRPLGTLGMYAWNRTGPLKGHRSQKTSQSDPDRESLRWPEAVSSTGELLQGRARAIHLMDREGDCFELLASLVDDGHRFVIRLCHERRLIPGRKPSAVPMLFSEIAKAPRRCEREVAASQRGSQNRSAAAKKLFPPRDAPSKFSESRVWESSGGRKI